MCIRYMLGRIIGKQSLIVAVIFQENEFRIKINSLNCLVIFLSILSANIIYNFLGFIFIFNLYLCSLSHHILHNYYYSSICKLDNKRNE